MILSEYEAKRQQLDAQMEKLNEMESEKKWSCPSGIRPSVRRYRVR